MTTGKYVLFFSILLLVLLACLTHELWGPPLLGMGTASAAASSGGVESQISILNICITIILSILLLFSILNIYSFFNAQIQQERRALLAEQGELRKQLEAVDRVCRESVVESRDNHLYEKNLLRLLVPDNPVHVRTAAAGFFYTTRPRDNDLPVLESLLHRLSASNSRELAPLGDELEAAVARWRATTRHDASK
jgi:hypothetical protein